ncbi:MAG: DUF3644 domain-containing protein [Gammaproteobacteria bacterium]|nr:DUF3644 domain-containing protein [Gammaproteobacteria bacterium]MYB37111.1 DUF3644 domain-containing protein [Gammaproteobacteria bacterium]
MHQGYVLDFTDHTMSVFFDEEFQIDIDADSYHANGSSKAKRLRTFLAISDDHLVTKVLRKLWERRAAVGPRPLAPWRASTTPTDVKTPLFDLISRIEGGSAIPRTDAIDRFAPDETLEELVASIERDIQAAKPAAALDRLHTYCMKKTAHLIKAHGGTCDQREPLHSRMGKYVGILSNERHIREISMRAMKSSISIFESFNDIRNNKSLAHDNDIVNDAEARYIFDSVSALLRFIKAIEADGFGQ